MPIALKTNVSKKPLLSVGLVSDIRLNIVGEKSIPNSSRRNFLITNENVNTEILRKICTALQCDVADIMEMVDSNSTEDKNNDRGENCD